MRSMLRPSATPTGRAHRACDASFHSRKIREGPENERRILQQNSRSDAGKLGRFPRHVRLTMIYAKSLVQSERRFHGECAYDFFPGGTNVKGTCSVTATGSPFMPTAGLNRERCTASRAAMPKAGCDASTTSRSLGPQIGRATVG